MNSGNHNDLQNTFTIPCIGVDGLIHECEPHLDVTVCGCQVAKKKVGNYDYAHRFSCYPCTY